MPALAEMAKSSPEGMQRVQQHLQEATPRARLNYTRPHVGAGRRPVQVRVEYGSGEDGCGSDQNECGSGKPSLFYSVNCMALHHLCMAWSGIIVEPTSTAIAVVSHHRILHAQATD